MTTRNTTTESSVHLESHVMDEGQECFVITTATATYFYQKEACGFSSLIDRDGNDWINYKQTKGPRGSYRGIPNMGHNAFGHPGFTFGAQSWVSEQRPDFVQITSESADGTWLVHWEFYANHASMNAVKVGKRAWLLYEGTPGGEFHPKQQYWMSSDGQIRLCNTRFRGRLPAPKWVAFCDPRTSRSLVLDYKGKGTRKDTYWPMDGQGGMTVFGFGRSDFILPKMLLSQAPFRFSFALIDSLYYETLKAACASF